MFRRSTLPFAVSLAALALGMSTSARAEWQVGSSKHFLVYSDDKPDNVKEMTERLERFDRAVRTSMNLREPEVGPDARVTVFVLSDVGEVQKMVGGSAKNVAGFYRPDLAPGPLAFVPRSDNSGGGLSPMTVLQHEYTHHVMFSSWGDVVFPPWFREGFAELFATARFRSDGSVVVGAVPVYRSYGIDRMNFMPVERLVHDGPNYRDIEETSIFYGRAWLLTHYLMFDPERAKQLAAYIGAINEGKSEDEANKLIGIAPSLDVKLNSYVKRPSLPAATLSADKLPIGEVTVRPLSAGEAATMPARMRSRNGVDEKGAQEVVALARQEAAPYPNDAGAQNELAEAEYDARNFAASEAAADRAMAADPKSVHALIYKGMSRMAAAEKAGNTDPAVWNDARRWFLAANKVDPLYSYPIQLYYESFGTAKQAPSKGAENGLLYAYLLAPQNLGLRLEAAHLLLDQGKMKAARVALEPIAFSEHGGTLPDLAKKALAAIDKGDTAAALEALKPPKPADQAENKKS